MLNNIDKVIENNHSLIEAISKGFCHKQGFNSFNLSDINVKEVIVFNGEFIISFSDILIDTQLNIPKGIAVRYMQGFDMDLDDAQIGKEVSYREYLESKKLI